MQAFEFNYAGRLKAPEAFLKYIKQQQKNPEKFVNLPLDKKTIEGVKNLYKKYAKARGLVVIGIGGSNLGTLAVYKALRPKKEICFAETLDAGRLDRILNHIKLPAVVMIISKSGTTAETIANAAVLLERLDKKCQAVAVTDEGSKLWQWAKKRGVDVLATPKEVSGRYSVFSAVGLLPLALTGVRIEKLLAGAKAIAENCLSLDVRKNPAAASALAIYENWQASKSIHDTFIFEPDLEYFGRWYRQLTGESIGKNGQGITPTVSIGTTDLHSVAQLYLDGPKDKFTTFVSVRDRGKDFVINKKSGADELVPDISGKSFNEILQATLDGVKTTYQKKNLPFAEIELAEVSEESLGALLQMKMMEMAYLGKLMGVNPFDQPAVELYKEEVRKLLKKL